MCRTERAVFIPRSNTAADNDLSDRCFAFFPDGSVVQVFFQFRTGSGINWMGENDLTCATDEALQWSVARIKEACDEQLSLCDKQLLFMDRYDILGNGIEIATYSDGSRIVGNFADEAMTFENISIPAKGYVVM